MTHMEDINSGDSPATGKTFIQAAAFDPISDQNIKKRRQLTPLQQSLIAALVISALVLAYLFSAKSLYIATVPSSNELNAVTIDVDGIFTIQTGDRYLLLPGEHTIEVKASGYHPYSQTIDVTSESAQQFNALLQPLPGHLTVNTYLLDIDTDSDIDPDRQKNKQPVNVDIIIDQKTLGSSHQEIRDITAGMHQLTINHPRYQPVSQSIDIVGRDQSQQLDIELQPNWAEVSIHSIPTGAEVFSGEESLGITPLTAELNAGKHQLLVKLDGYKSWQQTLRVSAQQILTLPDIQLLTADSRIAVTSKPSGASVTVNGQFQGQTPVDVFLPPNKSYRFTLFKDGYDPQHRNVSLAKGDEQALHINLDAELGSITIQAQPSDALLYVDGRLMGRANQEITLPAKQHRISVRKDGYAEHTANILPRPDLPQTLKVSLLTNKQHRWSNTPKSINTTVGQELLLFRPEQTFTMGASRREQGRRSNESQRTVKLQRAFYLSTTPVSNGQYREFERFHSSGHVKGNSLNGDNYPVVNINWYKAAAYCNWLSEQEGLTPFYSENNGTIDGFNTSANGYRLPTEAEWAWAARLENGAMKKFPWGRELPPTANSGNYGDRQAAQLLGHILPQYDDGYAVTAPLKRFPANSKKLYGFGGNTAEWVNDFYSIKTGLSLKTEVDPVGPDKGDYHVIRGSSWAHATMTDLRMAFRDYSDKARNDVGFRIARYAEGQ